MWSLTPTEGRRRVEHQLRAGERERAPALGEVPVVADVDAHLADRRVEHGVAEIAVGEVVLLVEALDLGDVDLAELAEVAAVRVDHGGGVVERAAAVALVDRRDDDHAVSRRRLAHRPGGGPVRHRFRRVEPPVVDGGGEVGRAEDLLQAQHLHALPRRLLDQRHVGGDHALPESPRWRSVAGSPFRFI